ncbi:peptidylprolyl isomerase [Cystobacter fuscus]|uniref:peptidylprolyl isomerase n=1 Tax=Cystobacter fuscus TaxID=43 RepID=UPI002B2899CC|nr:hypothetical protein F0U63_21390 [Cystobacter fuscus]
MKNGLGWGRWASLGLVLGLVACGDRDRVAKVGRTELLRADLSLYMTSHGGELEPAQALDALVDRSLLEEGAREAGLLEDPQVAARVAAARREVLANAYLDKVAGASSSEEALRQRYEAQRESLARKQVHVAHIIVRVQPGTDARTRAEARARINAIYARLVAGEDFGAVARESSDDAATAQRGGELDPILEGQVEPRFFAAVAELKKGELSKPFETAFGLHVARALEAPRTVVPEFEEVRGQLAAGSRREAEEALMQRLRSEISVKRYPEHLADMAGPKQSEGEKSR